MPVLTTVSAADAPFPAFDFHWDRETEILAGRHAPGGNGKGFTGSWEIESPTGAVVVLETEGGVLCGVEVVVWPDVETVARLAAPHPGGPGRVSLTPPDEDAVGLIEIEAPVEAEASESETVIHLRFGRRTARSVAVADNLVADLDGEGRLAGLWLKNLPLFPSGG